MLTRRTPLPPRRKPPARASAPMRRTPPVRRRTRPRRGPARDPRYLAWVRTLACAGCGIEGQSEAAHTGRDGGMRMKASDYSVIPLCRACHRTGAEAYHRVGRREFEEAKGMSCEKVAGELRSEYRQMQESA